jgi:hypothetical protein
MFTTNINGIDLNDSADERYQGVRNIPFISPSTIFPRWIINIDGTVTADFDNIMQNQTVTITSGSSPYYIYDTSTTNSNAIYNPTIYSQTFATSGFISV